MAKSKIKNKKLSILSFLLGMATIAGPIITHSVDKHHEDTQLKEQHKHDLDKSNLVHLHSTDGFKHMIDELKQQLKMKQEELDIAKGAYGALTQQVLDLQSEVHTLTKKIAQKEHMLQFYMGRP